MLWFDARVCFGKDNDFRTASGVTFPTLKMKIAK